MSNPSCLLSTTYFGPVQWYQKLHGYSRVLIEACESFVKQTYRNRCLIATAQGVQALTVPVSGPAERPLLSDHGNWRHQHWQAITSAYGDSPFLEYYEDDLRPFFFERSWETLFDYNEAIRRKMCELLDISPVVGYTQHYINSSDSTALHTLQLDDYRYSIRPKQAPADPSFLPRPYYQVFSLRQGFLPNLSILDLLLNMGPEAVFFLQP